MTICRRLIAPMLVCSVVSASVGCTSMKTNRAIAPGRQETMFRNPKADDTVWIQTRTGRTARSVIQQVEAATITPDGASGQDAPRPTRNNAVYVELLGNGGLYSVNYERALTPALRVRLGAGAWTTESFWSDAETRIRTFPVMLQMVRGNGGHHLEAGIGLLPGHRGRQPYGDSGGFVTLIGLVGYRYEPPQRRFVFRGGFTPFYGFGDSSIAYPEEGFFPSLGLSFGARF